MKEKFEQWKYLTGRTTDKSPIKTKDIITIRTLPGVLDLESKLLLNQTKSGVLPPGLEEYINGFSKQTFGTIKNDHLFKVPDHFYSLREGSEEWYEIVLRSNEHDDQYDTAEATDDEAVAILLELGVDFRDERGQPLRCTLFLCRQAEAAAKGMMGTLPDRVAVGLEVWASNLEREAQQHMARKRKP